MVFERATQEMTCPQCGARERLKRGPFLATIDVNYSRLQEFAAKHARCRMPLFLVEEPA